MFYTSKAKYKQSSLFFKGYACKNIYLQFLNTGNFSTRELLQVKKQIKNKIKTRSNLVQQCQLFII